MATTKKRKNNKRKSLIVNRINFNNPTLLFVIIFLVVVGVFLVFRSFASGESTAAKSPDCLSRSSKTVLSGSSPLSQFKQKLNDNTGINAIFASWTSASAGNYPIILYYDAAKNHNLCWVGGKVTGLYNEATTSWNTYHGVTAMLVHSPHMTIDGISLYNTGDGIGFGDGDSSDWSIWNVYMSHVHDDCIENDYMHNGYLDGALLNGCYSGLSARGHSGQSSPPDGRNNTWTIRNSMIYIQDTPTVFKGTAPGHGGIFKWSETDKASTEGYGTMLDLENLTIRLDGDKPNHQDYNIPQFKNNSGQLTSYIKSCRNVKIVWEGTLVNGIPYFRDGTSAASQFTRWPSGCMELTTDMNVWNDAVRIWKETHPSVVAQ